MPPTKPRKYRKAHKFTFQAVTNQNESNLYREIGKWWADVITSMSDQDLEVMGKYYDDFYDRFLKRKKSNQQAKPVK